MQKQCDRLYYSIAEHTLLLYTPNAKTTAKLLPSFTSFRVDNQGDQELLFTFTGNTTVAVPTTESAECVTREGVIFQVYNETNGVTISMKTHNRIHYIHVATNKREVTTDLSLLERKETIFLSFFLRIAYAMTVVHQQTIKLHASVIAKNGKALVFLGRSGTGKSTHSRLWLEHVQGSFLLNDDEPIIKLMQNGTIRVFGTPWSGSTHCYLNTSAEVTAFVLLRQQHENKLTKLHGIDAFGSLFQSVALLRSDKECREKICALIGTILDKVPIYRLDNRPDIEAVQLSENLLII
jgi:hypothetical protein